MLRRVVRTAAGLCLAWAVIAAVSLPRRSEAIEIWLSSSATVPYPAANDRVPTLAVTSQDTQVPLYIWARPDTDLSLLNVSLNLRAATTTTIDFLDVTVHNPLLTTLEGKEVKRFEFVAEPSPQVAPVAAEDRLDGIQGFAITQEEVVAWGMGPAASAFDSFYDANSKAWLLATVRFDVVGANGDSTDLYLQIGDNGLNHHGASSGDALVVFGDIADAALNGETQRHTDSASRDAIVRITVAADLNGDGSVDAADASLLFSVWGTSGAFGDLVPDGIIDAADAGEMFAAWTGDAAFNMTVPETPGNCWLWWLASASVCGGSRRRNACARVR